MSKSLRHVKPCTEAYFVGRDCAAGDVVSLRDPARGTVEVVWEQGLAPPSEPGPPAWGRHGDGGEMVSLAKAIARRCGLWDGLLQHTWAQFAVELLWDKGEDWSMTMSEAVRIWRVCHPSPIQPRPTGADTPE